MIISNNMQNTKFKDRHGNLVYCFTDVEQQNSILKHMNTFRNNREFCDVIIQVGTSKDIHEIYGHKVVLAASIPSFCEMFANETAHGQANGIQQYRLISKNNNAAAPEFDPMAFECIIEYAYTAELKIPAQMVREIYDIASRLKMTDVMGKCGQVLLATLSSDNCLCVRNMKSMAKDPELLDSVESYIRKNFEKIVESSSYDSQLPQIKFEFLLNSEQEEQTLNDQQLLSGVIGWIRNSLEKNVLDMETLKENVMMLYYNNYRNEIQDCSKMKTDSPEESEMIEDFKKLTKRISIIRSLSNDNIPHSINGAIKTKVEIPSKPPQFLFLRSDSDSSLSSSKADDDDNQDWKVLAHCRFGKQTLVGLVSIIGQLYLLSIKLRVKNNGMNGQQQQQQQNGGLHKTSMDSADGSSGNEEYCLIPPMSSPRCSVGVAEFKGKLFVCGGYDRGECLKTVETYDPRLNKWQLLQPMLVPRGRFAVAVVNDNIYAIGGCDGHEELSSAEYYDSGTGEWRSIHSAPVARSNAGVCSMDSRIYVIGGWNGQRGMKRCDIYDPGTDEWSQTASLITGRYQMGCCVLDDIIYAVGGSDSWSCLNSVEAFVGGKWRMVASLQTARRGCGVAAYKGKLYAVGGHDGIHALCSVEIYDPATDEWSFGKPMTSDRANVSVAVIGDRLYAVGGFNGRTFLNTIEYFDFENDQWTTSVMMILKKQDKHSEMGDSPVNGHSHVDDDDDDDEPIFNNNNNHGTEELDVKISKAKPVLPEVEEVVGH